MCNQEISCKFEIQPFFIEMNTVWQIFTVTKSENKSCNKNLISQTNLIRKYE